MDRSFIVIGHIEKNGHIVDSKLYGTFEDLISAYSKFDDVDLYSEYYSLFDKHYRRTDRKRRKEPYSLRIELTYKDKNAPSVKVASKYFHLPRCIIDNYIDAMF